MVNTGRSDESATIAALATAPLPSGLAVVRVSGSRSRLALSAIFDAPQDPIADPRRLIFGKLLDYRSKTVIDHALAVFMPGPHSYTGEDVAEFQFHGSPILVERLLRSLFAFGVSPAEPGEFTKRAFLNGKLDLVQAEAIAELIAATSEESLKLASEQLRGRFSDAIRTLGEPLRDALAEIEAALDFPDEGIEPAKRDEILRRCATAQLGIENLVGSYEYGSRVREGFRVLLCGRPNVGKSSLLNLLVGRPRAIVTEIAGTTRDLIEEEAVIGGYRFLFCDSAGIHEATDKVEQIGVELAKERVPWADVVILVVDATDVDGRWKEVLSYLKDRARRIWMVTNKIDLNPGAIGTFLCDSATCARNFYVSASERRGIDPLIEALVAELRHSLPQRSDANIVVTNARHRECLDRAGQSLAAACRALSDETGLEIVSVELRSALHALGEIIGTTYSEDILGRIFSKFCIGK